MPAEQALQTVEMTDRFDVLVLANGGGVAGQAGAVRLGIARALVEFNAELRGPLKKAGLLTRDPREHERKQVRTEGRSGALPVLQAVKVFVVNADGAQVFTCAPNLCQPPVFALGA